MAYRSLLLCLVIAVSHTAARTFTVFNSCSFTIWPAIFTDPNVGQSVPDFATGWEALSSSSVTFSVPDDWKAGRIWGRRDCNFTTNPGPTSCLDGGCNGGLECDKTTGTGVPPATVAEWTLQGDGNNDFYDVSLVDGYNLPMAVTTSVNCPSPSCPVDLGPECPQPLVGPFDSTGSPVGCKSACSANIDGDPTDSANCCSGSHDTAATCPPSGVAFYSYFKGNCPDAYAYAFDESSGTALWECGSNLNADYTLTFCPSINQTAVASATLPLTSSAPAPGAAAETSLLAPASSFGSPTAGVTPDPTISTSHSQQRSRPCWQLLSTFLLFVDVI